MNILYGHSPKRITHSFYFLRPKVFGMPLYVMYPRSKAYNEFVTFETEGNRKQCDKVHRFSRSGMF